MSEAANAGFTIREVEVGTRAIPQPAEPDLNVILPSVAGSLFADIEAKAACWQRPRPCRRNMFAGRASKCLRPTAPRMLRPCFRPFGWPIAICWRSGHSCCRRTLCWDSSGSRSPMAPRSACPIRYGAHRLRFSSGLQASVHINRGHLLGALIPLYLAMEVASHVNLTAKPDVNPEQHVEAVAAAFEQPKTRTSSRVGDGRPVQPVNES